MKRVAQGIICLVVTTLLCGIWTEFRWHQFEMPDIIGSEIPSVGKSKEEVCREWFFDYMNEFQGMNVPYEYRIQYAYPDQIEVLDDKGYVQIDFTVIPAAISQKVIQNLELITAFSDPVSQMPDIAVSYRYQGQMVLRLEEKDGLTVITEKMSPVQYQIQTPEFQEEVRTPQTEHYAIRTDRKETFFVNDGVLYVTFDSGETFIEVPDGYEKVCKEVNGLYNENLADGSYIISPDFTAFIGFDTNGTVMIYSKDQGKSWKESRISEMGYKANVFLSKTDNACVAVFAVDRSLGTDYYSIWLSEDEKTWRQISTSGEVLSNLSAAFWEDEQTGYYASGSQQSCFYKTIDQGQSWQEIPLPQAEEISEKIGFNPFDQVEQFYKEDGNLYLVIGQGEDGDYLQDGKLMKALFRSEDGEHFTFEKEVTDSLQEAG